MFEFVQTYGSWIVVGLLFLVMMRMHGSDGGGGCGMGCHDHSQEQSAETQDSLDSEPAESPSCH